MLVLEMPGESVMPWGGYVQYGSGISKAQGTFQMPSEIQPVGNETPGKYYNSAAWVGIGGMFGSGNLWQAGVEFDSCYQCGGAPGYSESARLWWEDVSNASSGLCSDGPCYYTGITPTNLWNRYQGSNNSVTVEVWTSGGYAYFEILINGQEVWGTNFGPSSSQQSPIQFTPNANSAEWIVEGSNPALNSGMGPGPVNIGTIEFESPSVTSSSGSTASFLSPVASYQTADISSGAASIQYVGGWVFSSGSNENEYFYLDYQLHG